MCIRDSRYIEEVVAHHSPRTAWLPWQPEEPVGPAALAHLATTGAQHTLV